MRVSRVVVLLFSVLFLVRGALAQSPNGTISGIVLDSSGAAIPGAAVFVINSATGVAYPGKANAEGYYVVPNLPPGPYRIQVSNFGFKTIIKPDIVVHVEDALAVNFTLPIGSASELVTVEGGTPLVNTENATVSTVVDRNFVENMPLNGRSFQDLILLVPGIVSNSPQETSFAGVNGEFSVNGQRTESNYYTVDGVSANTGVYPGDFGAGNSGSVAASTALGTTQALVSVDALQEFRVQTSTYSAEYGRNPGGQFALVTRSGTNDWHGTLFDYLRNSFFDANDWFNDYFGQKEPPLRQNDFGGTVGGPVYIPNVYDGKDRTFFFFSYEGLRLIQPQPSSVNYVPDSMLRQDAPSALQPILRAFPLANGPDLGNGLAEFISTWSNPSSLDAYSLRVDHTLNEKLKLFFRFGDTPSSAAVRLSSYNGSPSVLSSLQYATKSYTAGAIALLTSHLSNDLRFNYSTNYATSTYELSDFGGARSVDLVSLQGFNQAQSPAASVGFELRFPGYTAALSSAASFGEQKQWNLVDSVKYSTGRHYLTFGLDYRRLTPLQRPTDPNALYFYLDEQSVLANSVDIGFGVSQSTAFPLYTNFSGFGQDEWHLKPRLSLSLGLRWEINPPPGVTSGRAPYTIRGSLADPGALTLASEGTPLWHTSWNDLAPRAGAAFILRNEPGYETVLRGGFGVFYDTGQQAGSQGFQGPGFQAQSYFGNLFGVPARFPVGPTLAEPPVVYPPVAPYSVVYGFPSNLQLPLTLQWNVSLGQSLGQSQVVTVSYVGANGRRLLRQSEYYFPPAVNPDIPDLELFENGLTSSYNALQIQLQRRVTQGLKVLASYTWSHSIDFGSFNAALPYERASSDFDVRQNFSSAFSYDLPGKFRNRAAAAVFSHWGIDDRFSARTGFPITLDGSLFTDPITGRNSYAGLNLVPGQPLYLHGPEYPGGTAVNPAAFTLPSSNQVGDAPRNLVRGFGAWQMDVAIRREFPLFERAKLQFRAEAFNVFNHPNFGTVNSVYCAPGPGCTFGQATATLAQSLGVLSSLYQMGGPRSMQFALKVVF